MKIGIVYKKLPSQYQSYGDHWLDAIELACHEVCHIDADHVKEDYYDSEVDLWLFIEMNMNWYRIPECFKPRILYCWDWHLHFYVHLLNMVDHFDYVFSPHMNEVDRLRNIYEKRNVHHISEGWNPNVHRNDIHWSSRAYDIGFVGQQDNVIVRDGMTRHEYLIFLKSIYNNRFEAWQQVHGVDYCNVMNNCKISFDRYVGGNHMGTRVIESLAMGCHVVTDNYNDFPLKEHVWDYDDKESLIENINLILNEKPSQSPQGADIQEIIEPYSYPNLLNTMIEITLKKGYEIENIMFDDMKNYSGVKGKAGIACNVKATPPSEGFEEYLENIHRKWPIEKVGNKEELDAREIKNHYNFDKTDIKTKKVVCDIIIPIKNRLDLFTLMLINSTTHSFNQYSEFYNLIIINNAQKDDTEIPAINKIIQERFPNNWIYTPEKELNFTESINAGLELCDDTDSLFKLILNSDLILDLKETVDSFKFIIEKNIYNIGTLNPWSNCDYNWKHMDEFEIPGVKLIPGMDSEKYDLDFVVPNINEFIDEKNEHYSTYAIEDYIHKTDWNAFYCTAIPSKVIEKVGYLNEDFHTCGSDSEFCKRVKSWGYENYWSNLPFVFHWGAASRKVDEKNNYDEYHRIDKKDNIRIESEPPKRALIFSGPNWQRWDWTTPYKEGIGGSETCQVELVKQFAEVGCMVDSVCDLKEDYGNPVVDRCNGERWIDCKEGWYSHLNKKYDLIISVRDATFPFDIFEYDTTKVVWVHDCNLSYVEQCKDKVDYFVTLSDWHKSHFVTYNVGGDYEHKVITIPDGINLEVFKRHKRFVNHYDEDELIFIYSSSLDRGFTKLCKVVEAFMVKTGRKAKIFTFYGVETLKEVAKNNQEKHHELLQIKECCKLPFVEYVGKVSQYMLNKMWNIAHFWVYPTYFHETFCMTAMQAMATETPIVCSNLAALEQTVGEAGMRIFDNGNADAAIATYVEYIEQLVDDENLRKDYVKLGKERVKDFTWDNIYRNHWAWLLHGQKPPYSKF